MEIRLFYLTNMKITEHEVPTAVVNCEIYALHSQNLYQVDYIIDPLIRLYRIILQRDIDCGLP